MSRHDGAVPGHDRALDGNVAAGVLTAVFAVDVTSATGRCAGCGRTGPLGDARAYVGGPGVVVRCSGCDGVLVRVVQGGGRTWVDVRGLTYLQIDDRIDDGVD